MALDTPKHYDKLKILILMEWPIIARRSPFHQGITKAMVAKLAIEGQISLPSRYITHYLFYANLTFVGSYIILIYYLLKIRNFEVAYTKIIEAKKTSLGESQKDALIYLEANYFFRKSEKEVKKAVELLEDVIKSHPTPFLCRALITFHNLAPDEVKIPLERLITLYERAVLIAPGLAYQLARKYIEDKAIFNIDQAKKWYEVAANSKHVDACYDYARLLYKQPEHLEKCLSLLSVAKNTIPQANFLYIKLKLKFLTNQDVFYGKKIPLEEKLTKKEGRKIYQELLQLSDQPLISRREVELLCGTVQEFIFNNQPLALDHYRAACEYGSAAAHNKCLFIYATKILTPTALSEREFHIRSLQSLLDSSEFFFKKPLPTWANPFDLEKFKHAMDAHKDKNGWGDFKGFIEESKEESILQRIKNAPSRNQEKLIEIVKLDYEGVNAEQTAELVRYAGNLAHEIVVTWGAKKADFLHKQLLDLCGVITKKMKSKTNGSHFNLWSLMCILKGISHFKIYSKDQIFIDSFLYVINSIRDKLNSFGYWKLIMLLDSAKDLCYQILGVPKFIEDVIFHVLSNRTKLFTEVDGDIRLSYILAILDNHYNIFNRKTTLQPLLTQLLTKIAGADIALYQSRTKVVKDCFFALNYFHSKKLFVMEDLSLIAKLKEKLLESPPTTTRSRFQGEVVDFIKAYFASSVGETEAVCVESKEEKMVFTKPADLGLTFKIPHPSQSGKTALVEVIIEADGTPHFWLPVDGSDQKPIYNLDTAFYTTVLKQQGINVLRVEFFKWSALTDAERYDFFRGEFAKLGLQFPPFSAVSPAKKKCRGSESPDYDSGFEETRQPRMWRQPLKMLDLLHQEPKNWRNPSQG